LEQTGRPYCARGGGFHATGPDVRVEPKLALALHLVLHELAANANKYGALSSPSGCIKIQWDIRQVAPGARKLAVVWTEHGGPEVKVPRRHGFGTRLIKRALDGYGEARLEFDRDGLACLMLIDVDR
jgi:two-component sensor histidine kinase